MDNIKSRAAAFNGQADLVSSPANGRVLTIAFALIDKLLKHK